MIRTLLRLLPARPRQITHTASFPFSNQAENEAELDSANDRAANFYRNSVRRININDKGRGKFTQHHLLRLIKLTESVKQTPMLFEAYYNYLGHFTVISNSTVDKMLTKVLSFPQFPLDSVLEVYQNHNYLAYYPGYAVTKSLLKLTEEDEQAFGKVLLMLSRSPLVKWDQEITQYLMDVLSKESLPQKIFSTTIKLIVQKQELNILGIKLTHLELLNFLSERIVERYEKVGVFSVRPSDFMLSFLRQIAEKEQLTQNTRFQLTLLSLTFGVKQTLYQQLTTLTDKQKQTQLFGYFKHVNPLFINEATEYFSTFPLSEELKAQLDGIRPQQ